MNNKVLPLILLGLFSGLALLIYLVATNTIQFGYNVGYEPTQPIQFSHKTHAGDNKIDCKYCHVGVGISKHALVPSLNLCMNCHLTIKTSSPEIAKLLDAYINNKPIEWQKVNLLPDHVKFNHGAHIARGKSCAECHGEVQNMSVVKQKESLSMGFCVNCHRKPENNGPTHCSACHN